EQIISNANPSVAEDIGRWAGEQLNRFQSAKTVQAAAQAVVQKGGSVRDKLMAYLQVKQGVQDLEAGQEEATPKGAENSTMQRIKDVAVNTAQSEAVQESLAKGKLMLKSAASAINANARAALSRMSGTKASTDEAGKVALKQQADLMAGLAE